MASKSSSSKAQLRAQARATAKLLREQQERAERRDKVTRRSLLGLGGLTVAGGVATVVYLDNSRKSEPQLPDAGGTSAGERIPAQAGADASLSFGKELVPGDFDPQAKMLELYFDYACSHCAVFDVVHADEIKKLVQDGTVTLVLHPVKILGSPWTDIALNALGVVLANEPNKAYEFHNEVFAMYAIAVNNKDSSALTLEGVTKAAQQVGVSQSTTDQFSGAIEANQFAAWAEKGTKKFSDDGFTGTPTVVYDGKVLDLAQINSPTGLTDQITAGAAPANS